jgi:putative nucleotidyltransferase with HDIG domain
MAMTAKLLQLANSALFGLQRQVSHPAEAVLYLGMETTKSVLLLAHSFSYFDRIRVEDFSVDELWKHSLQTGKFAQTIAADSGAGTEIASQSFTAGMLHDIGKLALAANLPEKFGQAVALARTKKAPLSETETEVIGASHGELGACLLATWGLPAPVVEGVALHHYPVQLLSQSFCPLTAVHVANGLNHETEPADRDRASSTVDRRYLSQMNLSGRLDEWRALCLEPARRAAA